MQGKRIGVTLCLAWLIACTALVTSAEDTKTPAAGDPAAKADPPPQPPVQPPTAVTAPAGDPNLGFDAARLRLEAFYGFGTRSGHRSRDGDIHLRAAIDYEIPVIRHMTVSPRVIPYMYIREHGNGHTLNAFGLGVALRGYSNGIDQRGFFGELTLNLIGQTAHFTGNTGTVNFLEEFGGGYEFKSGWHLTAKISHISNAGLAEHNAGLNAVGLGAGYSFKLHKHH